MPTSYNQYVEIINGPYKGERGILVGDCSWFENYKIKLHSGGYACARTWQLEKIW
jgi:hypothetical protein